MDEIDQMGVQNYLTEQISWIIPFDTPRYQGGVFLFVKFLLSVNTFYILPR
jgi:hypothetical protein